MKIEGRKWYLTGLAVFYLFLGMRNAFYFATQYFHPVQKDLPVLIQFACPIWEPFLCLGMVTSAIMYLIRPKLGYWAMMILTLLALLIMIIFYKPSVLGGIVFHLFIFILLLLPFLSSKPQDKPIEPMKRLGTALLVILVAFAVPFTTMASWFALSTSGPSKLNVPVLNNAMKLTPLYHSSRTAFRNQHRLAFGSLLIALFLGLLSVIIDPDNKKKVGVYILVSTLCTGLAGNLLDCSWLFRGSHGLILPLTLMRTIPWFIVGTITWFILSRLMELFTRLQAKALG